jgi:hypothetical protein
MLPTTYAVTFAVFSFSHVCFSHSEFNSAAASIMLPKLCQIGGNLNITIMYPNVATNANLYVYNNCVAGKFHDDQAHFLFLV